MPGKGTLALRLLWNTFPINGFVSIYRESFPYSCRYYRHCHTGGVPKVVVGAMSPFVFIKSSGCYIYSI